VQTGVSVVDAPGTKTSANQFGGYAGAPAAAARSPAASPNSGNSSGGGFCCGVKREGRFCGECGKPGDAAAASSPAPVAAAASPTKNWNTGIVRPPAFNAPSAAGAGERCGKCHERVYDAEKVVGGGKSWHSACFRVSLQREHNRELEQEARHSRVNTRVAQTIAARGRPVQAPRALLLVDDALHADWSLLFPCSQCQDCRTGLSSTTLNDKDGGIYCGACYAKRFGPKGFGFSGGSASTFAYTK
jgi:hypothetical protein